MSTAPAQDPAALLSAHGIRPTANRIMVVRQLAQASQPMSLLELEVALVTIDRSNIHRILTTLREARLLHVLEEGSSGTRYELCHSHDGAHDDDLHVHFHCERCGQTFCLTSTPVPEVTLPEGYVLTGANYMLKGLCPHCRRLAAQPTAL